MLARPWGGVVSYHVPEKGNRFYVPVSRANALDLVFAAPLRQVNKLCALETLKAKKHGLRTAGADPSRLRIHDAKRTADLRLPLLKTT